MCYNTFYTFTRPIIGNTAIRLANWSTKVDHKLPQIDKLTTVNGQLPICLSTDKPCMCQAIMILLIIYTHFTHYHYIKSTLSKTFFIINCFLHIVFIFQDHVHVYFTYVAMSRFIVNIFCMHSLLTFSRLPCTIYFVITTLYL